MEMAPWRVQTSYLFRTLNFLRTPQGPRKSPWVPPEAPKGPLGSPPGGPKGPPGALGPEALRAGGLGKHRLAITRSVLERHGLSKGCGLAVFGEAGSR